MVAVDTLEHAKQVARWGTYGKDGSQPLEWKLLVDYSTEHLQAILKTQGVGEDYYKIITSILKDRGHANKR